jgi:hypothetical protein
MKDTFTYTYSGKRYYPLDPKPSSIDIRDIAHALSLVCRWNGQIKQHFSVAAHSIVVSNMVPVEHALCALLHDASEAYLPDMPSPIKSLLPDFRRLEDAVQQAVAQKFSLQWPFPQPVHEADVRCRHAEYFYLRGDPSIDLPPFHLVPNGRELAMVARFMEEPPDVIEQAFLMRYEELTD